LKRYPIIFHLTIVLILAILSSGCVERDIHTLDGNSYTDGGIPEPMSEPMPEPTPEATPEATPQPPLKPLSLAWFYHAPADGVDPGFLAQYFDIFISTRDLASGRDQLKGLGSQAVFYQYVVLNEVLQAETCDAKPYDQQAASRPGDFCRIDRLHPDWFLLTSDAKRIQDKPPYDSAWMMDPSNPEWRQFWIERVLERDFTGWDGVFLDNLEANPRYQADNLMKYPLPADYQQANLGFLKMIYEEFHSRGLRVFANILHVTTIDEWQLYLPYLDGVMIENFAVDWESGQRLTEEEWELHMQCAFTAQAQGKEVILVARGESDDIPRQQFALASYYLINNGKAYFRYTSDDYDEMLWYLNYLIEPGAPLGDLYFDNGLWKRDFENGQVVVDLINQSASINFSE
jgi:hypothetical protein